MSNQKGAAVPETFVLMLVLTPIMFGIPMIGKLIDLRQTTTQASRYVAWEATVDNPEFVPKDVQARFFSNSYVPLGGDTSEANSLWGGNRNGETTPTLREVESQKINNYWGAQHAAIRLDENTGAALRNVSAYDAGASGSVALKIQEMVEGAGDATSEITGGSWMDSGVLKGMLKSDVRADVEANGWVDTLTFTDSTVIMYDNWSAGTDGEAGKRARAMVPAGALQKPADIFASFGNFPLFKELLDFDNAFGRVDMRPLPASEKRERVLMDYTGD